MNKGSLFRTLSTIYMCVCMYTGWICFTQPTLPLTDNTYFSFLRVPACNIYFRPICLAIWAESPVQLSVAGAMDHMHARTVRTYYLYICLFHVYWRVHGIKLLYCIVLYCIVLYCIVLYCIVLYCIVLYCIVLYCIVLYCIVLYCVCVCVCVCVRACVRAFVRACVRTCVRAYVRTWMWGCVCQ